MYAFFLTSFQMGLVTHWGPDFTLDESHSQGRWKYPTCDKLYCLRFLLTNKKKSQNWVGLLKLIPLHFTGISCMTIPRGPQILHYCSVQLLSRVQLFVTPWTALFPVHHRLLELAQTHVHWVSGIGDAIQQSHPLLSPTPPAFNLSQHQGLF